MSTMTDETYNGWKNRETWAFNLHWQNDRSLYNETLDMAREWLKLNDVEPGAEDFRLGEFIVDHWRDTITEWHPSIMGAPLPETLRLMAQDVGSWWRIDYTEVGAAVRESLDAEGMTPDSDD